MAVVVSGLLLSLLLPSSAAAVVRSEFFGIVQTATLDNQDIEGLQDAHVRTNRFVLKWGWVQPTQSSFRWGPADRFIGSLARLRIRTLPSLWGNPDWLPGSASTPPIGGPTAEQKWRTFLKAIVGRYGPGGTYWGAPYHNQFGAGADPLPIQAWQIWNEPNLQKFFAPSPSPGKYGRLLQISADAIHSKAPAAKIVLAGMPGDGDMKAWDFLKGLYSVPNIKSKFDAAALHPYAPTITKMREAIEKVRGVMRSKDDQATELWLTELAWGSAPPDSYGINKGPDGQATMLNRAYNLILDHRAGWNVQRLFWYHWRDPQDNQASCSFCASAGLLRYDRTPKPAYAKFIAFTAETTKPQATITAGPAQNGFTNDPTPSFSFTSSEHGSTFACKIDTKPYKACKSPYTTPQLSNGGHAFLVRAIDAAGNESPIVWRGFTVDTVPPQTTITSGPAGGSTTPDHTPTFGFSSSESGSTFKCRFDSQPFAACSGPGATHTPSSPLTSGSHTFQVRAVDKAKNPDPTPAQRTFTVSP